MAGRQHHIYFLATSALPYAFSPKELEDISAKDSVLTPLREGIESGEM